MNKAPDWIIQHRAKWEYRGQKRPEFAIPPHVGQESVWDYPRPPRLERDSREVTVKYKDIVIAQTTEAYRILETASPPTYYIPPLDIEMDYLKEVSGSSLCEWKGAAQYWDVNLPETIFRKVGWSYPDPFDEFIEIAGYISFYPTILDCYIGNEKVQGQPGGFYGGWITSNIIGPVKGEIPEASL